LVRMASQGRYIARVRGRAALLCACAMASLTIQPAVAAPVGSQGEDIARVGAAGEQGTLAGRLGSMPQRPNLNGGLPPAAPNAPMTAPTLTANSGAFDVQVDAPASNRIRSSRDTEPRAHLTLRGGALPDL
jgi:hypothetical protein